MRNGTFRVEYKPTEVGTYIIQADTARLDFDKPLSSVAALIPQSPLPSHLRSWLPSTKRSYFTVASLHFLSSSLFSPHLFSLFPARTFLLPSPHTYKMPIQLLYRPALHSICLLYGLCCPRRRHALYTAVAHYAVRVATLSQPAPHLSVGLLKMLCELFLPIVQSQAVEERDT